jgi:hypothetical protein
VVLRSEWNGHLQGASATNAPLLVAAPPLSQCPSPLLAVALPKIAICQECKSREYSLPGATKCYPCADGANCTDQTFNGVEQSYWASKAFDLNSSQGSREVSGVAASFTIPTVLLPLFCSYVHVQEAAQSGLFVSCKLALGLDGQQCKGGSNQEVSSHQDHNATHPHPCWSSLPPLATIAECFPAPHLGPPVFEKKRGFEEGALCVGSMPRGPHRPLVCCVSTVPLPFRRQVCALWCQR